MQKFKEFIKKVLWHLLFTIAAILYIPLWAILMIFICFITVLALPFWILMGGIVYKIVLEMFDSFSGDLKTFFNKVKEKTNKDDEV